jgi:transposase
MPKARKNYSASEKAKIALAALSGQLTQREITAKYGVHASQASTWKKTLKNNIEQLFSDRRKKSEQDHEELVEALYQKIGQFNIELDWLKKNLNYSTKQSRRLNQLTQTAM